MFMTKTRRELFTCLRRYFMIIYGASILHDKRHQGEIEKLTGVL